MKESGLIFGFHTFLGQLLQGMAAAAAAAVVVVAAAAAVVVIAVTVEVAARRRQPSRSSFSWSQRICFSISSPRDSRNANCTGKIEERETAQFRAHSKKLEEHRRHTLVCEQTDRPKCPRRREIYIERNKYCSRSLLDRSCCASLVTNTLLKIRGEKANNSISRVQIQHLIHPENVARFDAPFLLD